MNDHIEKSPEPTPSSAVHPSLSRIFVNRNLSLLLAGQWISQIGDKVYLLALSYWVMETTKSAAKMGLVLGIAMASLVVCGLFCGSLADRWNRKTILIATDASRGLVVLGVGLAIQLHALTFPLVVLSQILVAALSALFNATIPAIIPQMVAKRDLSRANAMRSFIYSFSSIIGPVLGGLLAIRYGYGITVYFNAWSFLVAAGCTAFIAYRHIPAEKKNTIAGKLREGYAYVFSHRSLLGFLGIVVVLHAFVGSLQVATPLLAGALQGGYAKNLGLLQTSLGIGGVAMAVALSIVNLRQRELTALLTGILGVGLCYALLSGLLKANRVAALWPHCLVLALVSALIIVAATCYETYLQANIDNAMAGRVFSIMNAFGSSTMALSMFGFGALAERFSFSAVLVTFGIFMSALSILFLVISGGRRFMPRTSGSDTAPEAEAG
jgi:MFS transporter, DHA3 family, macrolide efflux protein